MTTISSSLRTRILTLAAAIALALGVSGLTAAPASAADPFIATPNGMVGVQQEIVFRAPSLADQVATIGFVSGSISNAGQTAVNSRGFGSLAWTPTSAGTWTISGLGSAASIGATTITVASQSTITQLFVGNQIQTGVANKAIVDVDALTGQLAPVGTVTVRDQNQAVVATGALSSTGGLTSSAIVQWTPSAAGNQALTATFTPSSNAFAASTSNTQRPQYTTAVVPVALSFPAELRVGSPEPLFAILGNNQPEGSAAFLENNVGISGSIPTSNGVARFVWTPNATGIQTIVTTYTGNTAGFSGSASQVVNVQPAISADSITVAPVGGAPWNPGLPITLQAGSSTPLSATAASGATVLLSETGPCVIAGSTLTVLGSGQCVVTAVSPGTGAVAGTTATFTITVTSPPKKKRR